MKKEGWIILGLILLIIFLVFVIIIPNKEFKIVLLNKNLTQSNNSDIIDNNYDCERIGKQIWQEIDNNQGCFSDSDCKLGGLQVPCTLDNCGAGAVYNKNLNKNKVEDLSKKYISNCQTGCPACAVMGNQIVKCINKKCMFVESTTSTNVIKVCSNDSNCSNGLKCWARCNGGLHCATSEEIAKAPACLPNE